MSLHIGRIGASPEGNGSTDDIEAIGIDEAGALWVKPATMKFPYIYREAMEIAWDANRLSLISPRPGDWSHFQWFEQILKVAGRQGVVLKVVASTSWVNVGEALRQEIVARANSP